MLNPLKHAVSVVEVETKAQEGPQKSIAKAPMLVQILFVFIFLSTICMYDIRRVNS